MISDRDLYTIVHKTLIKEITMKKIVYTLIFTALTVAQTFAQTDSPVVVGGVQKGNDNATMEILSKGGTKGFMPPRLTTAQVTTLTSKLTDASEGLTVFNIDTDCLQYWKGAKWSDCTMYSNAEFTADCSASSIKGVYNLDRLVGDTEYLELKVNVTKAGPFTFFSDSKNGVRFNLTTVLEVGAQTIQIPAAGTPKATGDFTYNLSDQAGNAICSGNANFKTTVVDNNAKFSITCSGTSIVGNFIDKLPASGQILDVKVAVTSPGNYYLKTDTVNGLWFEGSGIVGIGTTDIILEAKGVANTITGDTGVRKFILQDKDGKSLGCTVQTILQATQAVFTIAECRIDLQGRVRNIMDNIYPHGYIFDYGDMLAMQINVTRPGPISLQTDSSSPVVFAYSGTVTEIGLVVIELRPLGTKVSFDGPYDVVTGIASFPLKYYNFGQQVASCNVANFFKIVRETAVYSFPGGLIQSDPSLFNRIKLFDQIKGNRTVTVPMNCTSIGLISCRGESNGLYLNINGEASVGTTVVLNLSGTLTKGGLQTFAMYDSITNELKGGFVIDIPGTGTGGL